MRLRHVLTAILVASVCTIWIRALWAVSAVEVVVLLAGAGVSAYAAAGRQNLFLDWPLLPCAAMAAWATLQFNLGWSEVPILSRDQILYWAGAAVFVWLGFEIGSREEEKRHFLKAALASGSAVAVAGIIQLFTSHGKVFWLFDSGYDSLVIGPFVSPNNYAAFVELLVPVALTLALREKSMSPGWLILAAALVASVIAAGSRAGTALVLAESIVVFLLHPRDRCRSQLLAWFGGSLLLFTGVVGFGYLWRRVAGTGDLFLVRREFLDASFAMWRAHPLRGIGLGTWPAVYPSLAVMDVGAAANHAHNEWAQWAAEGGVPALLFMLSLLGWIVRPAIRSVWGIGLLAVMLHALVDYPFLRQGEAAWIFAFIGAVLGGSRRARVVGSRWAAGALAAGFSVAALGAVRVGWADRLYRGGSPGEVRRALELAPRPEYWLAVADTDPTALDQALAANPYLTAARLRRVWDMEGRGDVARADRELRRATELDHLFGTAWSAANFYYRQRRETEFWRWSRRAADLSYEDLRPLFQLCFRMTSDAAEVDRRVTCGNRRARRNLLDYLTVERRLDDAAPVAASIAADPQAADREFLILYVDAALAAGRSTAARSVWEAMLRSGMASNRRGVDDLLPNGDFAETVSGRGFDWRLPVTDGVSVRQDRSGVPQLVISFSGSQAEQSVPLSRPVTLDAGQRYVLRFEFRTVGLAEVTGLTWAVDRAGSDALPAHENWRTGEWQFQAGHDVEQLRLQYRRVSGSPRIEGALFLRRVSLEVVPAIPREH